MRPDPRTWLFDAVQAAQRVQRFIHGRSYEDYLADELLRAGVERQFEIIGEALSQLRRQNPELAPDGRRHLDPGGRQSARASPHRWIRRQDVVSRRQPEAAPRLDEYAEVPGVAIDGGQHQEQHLGTQEVGTIVGRHRRPPQAFEDGRDPRPAFGLVPPPAKRVSRYRTIWSRS